MSAVKSYVLFADLPLTSQPLLLAECYKDYHAPSTPIFSAHIVRTPLDYAIMDRQFTHAHITLLAYHIPFYDVCTVDITVHLPKTI